MDFAPISGSSPQIQIHLAAALLAMAFGAVIFMNVKGTRLHKTLGWTYVVLLAVTALTAIFIRRSEGIPNIAGFTPIHLFVVMTAIGIPRALYLIRRGNVPGHARAMIGLYIGAIVIAGAFTLLPGRILNDVFFGG